MEYEKRDGKFYLKLLDGEIELIPDMAKQGMENTEALKRLFEKELNYIGNKSLSIEDYCASDLTEISKIDVFIENLLKVLDQQYHEGINPNMILEVIALFKRRVTENIKNPLLKNSKEINEYFLEKLLNIEKLFSVSTKQPESKKPDEVTKKLYSHIFNGNAFEVWQSMFNSFEINESSRTDVKFMYEEMKKDGLIFTTVNQTKFLDWISETYQITIEKTSNHSRTKERISIYSNAKQLYKS